jgi:hypothetical protein
MVTMIICLPMSIPAARSQNSGSSPASSKAYQLHMITKSP